MKREYPGTGVRFQKNQWVVMGMFPSFPEDPHYARFVRPQPVAQVVDIESDALGTAAEYGPAGDIIGVRRRVQDMACHTQYIFVGGIRFSGAYFRLATRAEMQDFKGAIEAAGKSRL